MTIDPSAFEQYRRVPNGKMTPARLLFGTGIAVVFWAATTAGVLYAGGYAYGTYLVWKGVTAVYGGVFGAFLASPAGTLASLATFGGLWIGLWAAMRLMHGDRLSALFGNSRRISRSGFAKGLVAVLITSLLSEVLLYFVQPDIQRGPIDVSWWLVCLIPVVALTLLQTSSEELMFRGYLLRGLASRVRNPYVWGLLPAEIFVALHWSPGATAAITTCVLISISAFALMLALLVYATGNLGASFGAHLSNILTGFLLISHQQNYNAFALFTAKPLEGAGWTTMDAALIAAIGVASTLLTALFLLHPRSPLKVAPDIAPAVRADLIYVN